MSTAFQILSVAIRDLKILRPVYFFPSFGRVISWFFGARLELLPHLIHTGSKYTGTASKSTFSSGLSHRR